MSDEPGVIVDDELIQKTANDFASFFKVSPGTNVESIDENIEGVLTRLDELYGMLDMIRSDNAVAINELLPQVRANMSSLKSIFEQIDQLEEFIKLVKRDVMIMEKEVKLVEEEFSTFNSIKKAISGFSFLGLKKKSTADSHSATQKMPFLKPEIFSTSDHLQMEKLSNPSTSDASAAGSTD